MVQLSSCSSPSTSGPSSCEQRSSIAYSAPAQLTTAISRSSHTMRRMAPGGSSVTGQMSMISGNEVQIRLSQEGLYRETTPTPSAVPGRLGGVHHPLLRVLTGVRMMVRGETDAHAELRSRVLGVTVLTIIVDLVTAALALAFERGHAGLHSYWDALFWTTTQILTVSSSLSTPETTGGKLLDVGLELYAVVVVTAGGGGFASFFPHPLRAKNARGESRPRGEPAGTT